MKSQVIKPSTIDEGLKPQDEFKFYIKRDEKMVKEQEKDHKDENGQDQKLDD